MELNDLNKISRSGSLNKLLPRSAFDLDLSKVDENTAKNYLIQHPKRWQKQ